MILKYVEDRHEGGMCATAVSKAKMIKAAADAAHAADISE